MQMHKKVISSVHTTTTIDVRIAHTHTEPQVQTHRLRVLVIDDEPLIRRAIERCLPSCEVVCADSADDAVRLALSQDFGVILCDLYMPGKSGSQVYTILRNKKPQLAERMVIITGDAGSAMEPFLECTRLPVLEKPFRPSELRSLVARYAKATATAGPGADAVSAGL